MRRPLSPIRYTASLNESDLMLCGCARLRSTTASSRQVQRGQAALCNHSNCEGRATELSPVLLALDAHARERRVFAFAALCHVPFVARLFPAACSDGVMTIP